MRKKEPVWIAFTKLIASNRPRYGGYIVHLGILILAIGAIASSFYSTQRDIIMQPGETYEVGDYSISYIDSSEKKYLDRDEFIGEFKVTKGDKDLGMMYPKQSFYREFRINATHAAIRSNPIEDFYIIPSQFSDDGESIFRILLNPLVWWMWAAGPVMAIGTIFALSPQKRLSTNLISKKEDTGL
jgi:cytochrome c-type biogenesis protein CcmF